MSTTGQNEKPSGRGWTTAGAALSAMWKRSRFPRNTVSKSLSGFLILLTRLPGTIQMAKNPPLSSTMKPHLSALSLILTGFAWAASYLPAQDDSYHSVRFVNEGKDPVEVKYWNPRVSRAPDLWKIPPGKSFDFADKDGKLLRVGIYSSNIVVNAGAPRALIEVGDHNTDRSFFIITWTGKDYKKPVPRAP